MIKSFRLSIVLLILLFVSSSASLAETSQMERNITVEQYIYSLMKTLSIEPTEKSIDGMERYTDEANKRYWTDIYTPQPLSRPLEKHEMIDFAVDALREKGNIEYGNPPEIHKMIKDFKDVPFRSRISTVIAVNMGLVDLDENGELNPLEEVSIQDASKFLRDVKRASDDYPVYKYLTETEEYVMWEHGYSNCILDGKEYTNTKVRSTIYSGVKWNGLYHLGDFPFSYDDFCIAYSTLDKNEERENKSDVEYMISVYKPGPVLHFEYDDNILVSSNLKFERNPELTKLRLEIASEFCKEYSPQNHYNILMEYLEKHTSEEYLKDDESKTERIIIDNIYYVFSHYRDQLFMKGRNIEFVSKRELNKAMVIGDNDR